VCRQSAVSTCPRQRTHHGPDLSVNLDWQGIVHAGTSLFPFGRQRVSRFVSKLFPSMSAFDPASVRKPVAEFTPRRAQKFQGLAPAKEVIVELRQKRASYRAIAELLTQHCLPTSKTAIATFCHEILGEITRPKRRLNRKRPFPLTATSGNGD